MVCRERGGALIMTALPETHYARSGDVCIAYQVTGAGPIDIVWAPGTTTHLDLMWEWPPMARFIEGFSAFCRLIRFDKRGTGLSDRPAAVATLEQRIDDIRAVMDAVDSERATIFGVSEGGSMACLFAAMHPGRTRSLVLYGTQARWVRTDDYPWGYTRTEYDQMVERARDTWPSREYVTGWGAGLGRYVDPAFLEWWLRYARAAASPSSMTPCCPSTRTSTTTCYAPANGPNPCATWSPPSWKPISRSKATG